MTITELSMAEQQPTDDGEQVPRTAFVEMYQGGVRVWGITQVYDDLFETLERIYHKNLDCSLPRQLQDYYFFTAEGILSHDLCVSIVTVLEAMQYKVEPRTKNAIRIMLP